jgi:NRPS condensation-like uncharacterized protein
MTSVVDRRCFLVTSLAAVLATPLAVEVQQGAKMWRIGFLEAGSASVNRHFLDAFRQGLNGLGYVERRNALKTAGRTGGASASRNL